MTPLKLWFTFWTVIFVILLTPIGAAQSAYRIVGVERNLRTLRSYREGSRQ